MQTVKNKLSRSRAFTLYVRGYSAHSKQDWWALGMAWVHAGIENTRNGLVHTRMVNTRNGLGPYKNGEYQEWPGSIQEW